VSFYVGAHPSALFPVDQELVRCRRCPWGLPGAHPGHQGRDSGRGRGGRAEEESEEEEEEEEEKEEQDSEEGGQNSWPSQ